jgi:quinol-cytochrome oxidoreductase complex cytochrome b subunit
MQKCSVCYIIIFIVKWGALTYWGVKQHDEISIGDYIIAPSKCIIISRLNYLLGF